MELKAQKGEMRATIHVKRKATGKTETYQVVGHQDPEKLKEIVASHNEHNKSKTIHGSAGGIVGEGSKMNNI